MLALSKAEVVRHMATEASKITDHRAHISTSLSASGPQGAHTKDKLCDRASGLSRHPKSRISDNMTAGNTQESLGIARNAPEYPAFNANNVG